MNRKPKMSEVITPELKSCVNAYLMARAHAEVMRTKVDEIHRQILTECPIYADVHGRTEQIFKSGDLYMCSNDALCRDFYDEADKRLRAAKLKPSDMPVDHCPALVAEHLQTKTEWMLIESAGTPFGITNDLLLSQPHGMEQRQKFIDLVVRLIVSTPGFKNPLTGKAA